MEEFIVKPFIGGICIGLAVSIMRIFNGRITGISGITGGLFSGKKHDFLWRVLFIFGLILSPALFSFINPLPNIAVIADTQTIVIAGLLVGFGTRYGSGCTSGHGICGIAQLRKRSIVSTLIFMAFGAMTVFVMRTYA